MEFKNFGLHPDLQKGIDKAGYINCMPVQEQVFSNAFGGQDLYVQSQTGTGKTAAFLTVIFQRLLTEDTLAKRKALIMAPTRELAVQIEEEAKMLGKFLPFKTGSFYGGVGYALQEKLLRENVQIMVGTPGRVLDLNKSGRMNLMEIAFLVLDEADRMFDMGFYPDLRKLIKAVPPVERRQTMLFSATLNAWVKNLAWEYTKTPVEIEITPKIVTVEEITQVLYHVSSAEKMPLLLGIFKREQPERAIIFCNTKKQTEIVSKRLQANGLDCRFIIGDLPQTRRQKVIDEVKAGKIKILVATDVAARGLDIEDLGIVINYDLPSEAENYVHRIGRTARAGKKGKAVNFASEQDVYALPAIERYIGKKIPSEIATQDLYEQDKSAGQYIKTDFYEERHHSTKHDGKRKPAATHKSHGEQGKKRKPEKTFDKKHRKHSHSRGENIHGVSTNGMKPHSANTVSANVCSEKTHEKDLSQLSMEERMALYKKKYTGGNSEHHKKSGKHQHIPKHKTAPLPAAQNKNAKTHHKHQIKQPEQQPAKKQAPVKKSVISSIIGFFKKK